jgi:hypothetical protein
LFFVSQLVDADLDMLFRKSGFRVLYSSRNLACGISHIGKAFQVDFSFTHIGSFNLLYRLIVSAYSENCSCSSLRVTLFVLLVVTDDRCISFSS